MIRPPDAPCKWLIKSCRHWQKLCRPIVIDASPSTERSIDGRRQSECATLNCSTPLTISWGNARSTACGSSSVRHVLGLQHDALFAHLPVGFLRFDIRVTQCPTQNRPRLTLTQQQPPILQQHPSSILI